MIKRILIKNFYQRGFPKKAIQAAKRIKFGMRDRYLEPSLRRNILRPIPIRTKFFNYSPSVGIIFRVAWLRVCDDPVLSHYFPTAPFPVWYNHRNFKSVLSYKHKNFDEDQQNREYKDFVFQKFNRPMLRKRSNTIKVCYALGLRSVVRFC